MMTSRSRQSKVDEPQVLTALFVHEKSTAKAEKYVEVPPGRQREVMRSVYVQRDDLKSIVDEGTRFPPHVIEVTVRAVDPEELRDAA